MAESRAEPQSRREAAPWPKVRLGEICEIALGKMLDQNKNKGILRRYLANVDVRWGSFDLAGVKEMPFLESETARYSLRYGDIVMCEGGEPGRCAVWKDQEPLMMYQKALHRIRAKNTADNLFLYYYFLLLGKNNGFDCRMTGSTIKHLPRAQLLKLEVSLPPLPTQRAIAEKLSRYDALIENNTRRIAILERMAEQLYKEWFVRRRFPGHEKAKWIGGLPEGWRIEKIKNVVQRLPFGRTYKEKELSSEGKVIVVDQSTKQWLGFHDDAPSHFANAEKPIILFGDHSCKFQLMTQDFSLGENVIPFIAEKKLNTYYLYYSVHRLICTEEYKRHWGRLSAMKILIPSLDKQNSFANIVSKHAVLILNLQRQNALLAKERDLLLPRLMSGRMKP